MRCEKTRTHLGWSLLMAAGLAACGGEAPAADSLAAGEVSGRWLLRSSETVNDCAELGSGAPFDLQPVQLREEDDALEVTQGFGDRIVYAASYESGWSRTASGRFEGCHITGTAHLVLRRVASSQLAGRYEATYATAGGLACEGLPTRCSVAHDLTGVRP